MVVGNIQATVLVVVGTQVAMEEEIAAGGIQVVVVVGTQVVMVVEDVQMAMVQGIQVVVV
jgi:hypothetical protein